MVEVIGAIAGAVGIITGLVQGGRWLFGKRRQQRALQADARPALEGAEPPYPVRLTCREDDGFHPESGYREGLQFEVFNSSDRPVTVKGFGLDITMRSQGEWHEVEQARHFPPYVFPVRLEPHDALDGYIDTEAVADEIYTRGETDYVVEWHPYVDLAGYGRRFVEVKKAS